jgi:hypothetical protein
MFGWRWSFDRPVVNHNPRKQPVDYLEDSIRRSGVPTGNPPPELPGSLSPKVVGPASSALIAPLSVNDNVDQQRRGLLKAMTAGVLTAGLNPGALALGSDFFQALYKVDPMIFRSVEKRA